MKACRRQPVDATPVWLMRQAGRYMKEYREIRARVPFLELCKNPRLVSEVTVTAARKLGVDAAIIFADLLLIVEPLGFGLAYDQGGGPIIKPALRLPAEVDRLREVEPLTSTPNCRSSASLHVLSRWLPTSSKAADRETTGTPRA
jgi:uroporphyrinogen decarboxylase